MKQLLIFGDSHTRQFAYRKNIIPVFLNSAKTFNLGNFDYVCERLEKFLKNYKIDKNKIITFFMLGEGDCRIQLTGSFYPHWEMLREHKKIPEVVNKELIDKFIINLKKLNNYNIDFFITPTGSFDPVIPALTYYNEKLLNEFTNSIDIYSKTIDNGKLIDSFRASNWNEDPIHLNSKICDVFLIELKNKNIIDNIEEYSKTLNIPFDNSFARDNIKVSRFGTLIGY